MRVPWLWGMLLMFNSGCRCGTQAHEESEPAPTSELKLLEPEEEQRGHGHCVPLPSPGPVLRAAVEDKAEPASLEVGGGVLTQSNFALFAQRLASSTQTFAALGGRGQSLRELELGLVHGSADPPSAVLHKGVLFGVVSDNEAMGQTLAVVRVDDPWGKPQVVRGPVVSAGRDDSLAASLAIGATGDAVLVWDQYDRASSRSRIWGQVFDASTLQGKRAPQVLSPPQVDAEEPRLEAGPTGFFLSYVELDTSNIKVGGDSLVDEPARALRVQLLDDSGAVSAPPLAISEQTEQLFAFDTLVSGPQLYLAYRSGAQGNTREEEVVHLARVGADGVIQRGVAQHALLGPGVPLLLGVHGNSSPGERTIPGNGSAPNDSSNSDAFPWLLARGDDAELLLAEVSDLNRVELGVEPELNERLPLARHGSQLLAVRAVGLDWAVEILDCAGTKSENPPAKAGGK